MQSGNPVLTLDLQLSCAFDDDFADRSGDTGLRTVSGRSHRCEVHSLKVSRAPHSYLFDAASRFGSEPHAAMSAS